MFNITSLTNDAKKQEANGCSKANNKGHQILLKLQDPPPSYSLSEMDFN